MSEEFLASIQQHNFEQIIHSFLCPTILEAFLPIQHGCWWHITRKSNIIHTATFPLNWNWIESSSRLNFSRTWSSIFSQKIISLPTLAVVVVCCYSREYASSASFTSKDTWYSRERKYLSAINKKTTSFSSLQFSIIDRNEINSAEKQLRSQQRVVEHRKNGFILRFFLLNCFVFKSFYDFLQFSYELHLMEPALSAGAWKRETYDSKAREAVQKFVVYPKTLQ